MRKVVAFGLIVLSGIIGAVLSAHGIITEPADGWNICMIAACLGRLIQ